MVREQLHFCVQKHFAKHLHYDFRLECRGVLLSWALPKGPPLQKQEKRLAIQVEDHALSYQYFEGIIPTGSYGAGKVEIWDKGVYLLPHIHEKKEIEKFLKQDIKKGHFTIVLKGERLQGEYLFHRLNHTKQNWLMIKLKD